MGPHPLWQLEDILPALALEPGSRVLDLGCGRGATSVFLARECGVTVTACDLWVSVEELEGVFREAGVERFVTPVNADVRQLPFADDAFDAIVSIDAFEYFGTDVHLLPALLRVLKSDGTIGMTTPGLEPDPYEAGIPDAVWSLWGPEVAASSSVSVVPWSNASATAALSSCARAAPTVRSFIRATQIEGAVPISSCS